MKAPLLPPLLWLLALLLLPMPRLQAQGRPPGPWRLTYQMVTERNWDGWDKKPDKKVLKLMPTAVRWNVVPDSIRLFLNCENPLIAPAKPRNGQLPIRFTATGAIVRLDAKHQRLLIVPAAPVVTLSAYRGQALVFKHFFKAIPPPLPVVECWYSGSIQPNDGPRNYDWRKEHILNLKAIPDPYFTSLMSDDAKYRVPYFSLTLLRNNIPIQPLRTINGPQTDVEILPDSIRSGDQFQINVQTVQRQNFRGEVENIPLQKQMVIPVQFR